MLTAEDKELLAKKGITEAQIEEQLKCFENGFPYLELDGAASLEKGIIAVTQEERQKYLAAWDAYKQGEEAIRSLIQANATASDNEDGDISNNIKVDINGDLVSKGFKIITYSVTDRAGNTVSEEVQLQL